MSTIQRNVAATSYLDQFHDFFLKLLELRRDAEQRFPLHHANMTVPDPTKTEENVQEEESESAQDQEEKLDDTLTNQTDFMNQVAQISFEVSSYLRNQEEETLNIYGQYAELQFKEVQYAMAAYADEFFLNAKWQGKTVWDKSLVEMNLFNSHVAGDVIFERIDEYLSISSPNATHVLGVIYYNILSMGFLGRYRGDPNAKTIIEGYKHQLFTLVTRRKPRMNEKDFEIFPQTYQHTVVTGKSHKIISPKWWWGAVVMLLSVLFIASHLVWLNSVHDLDIDMKKILEIGLLRTD